MAGDRDAAYTATKGGLEALTRSLAAELAPPGIRRHAIPPGLSATEPNAGLTLRPDLPLCPPACPPLMYVPGYPPTHGGVLGTFTKFGYPTRI